MVKLYVIYGIDHLYRELTILFSKAVGRVTERREIAKASGGAESPGAFSNNILILHLHVCTHIYRHIHTYTEQLGIL